MTLAFAIVADASALLGRGVPAAAVLAAALLVLGGCSEAGTARITARLEALDSRLLAVLPGGVPCEEPLPVRDPLYCFQTLAGIECYAEENPFGLEPGWRRSAPPDIRN